MKTVETVYVIIAGVIIAALIFGRTKEQYLKASKPILAWLVILGTVFAGVVYWDDFKNTKLYAALVPGAAVVHENGSMEFMRGPDGHFHISAEVNGVVVDFMVDTGASDICLSREDAKKVGLLTNELHYDRLYNTANGVARAAWVKLDNIKLGKYQTGVIVASVSAGGLSKSLLGMGFLDKMKSYRVDGDKLVLVP